MMKKEFKLLFLIAITFTLMSVSFASNLTDESDNLNINSFDDTSNDITYKYSSQSDDKDIIKNNKSIKSTDNAVSVNITSDNINQSFDIEDGEVYLNTNILSSSKDITINIYEMPSDITQLIFEDQLSEYNDVNIQLIGQNNLTLHNIKLYVNGFNQIKLENINFEYDTDYTDENYIQIDNLTNYMIMNNISINVERNDTSDSVWTQNEENNAVPLYINTKALVENCTLNAKLVESLVNWDGGYGIPQQLGVMIISSDVTFNNNNISIIGNGALSTAYYSMYGVFCSGKNLVFTNNNITINNITGYGYGLVVRSSNNLVSKNNITIQSKAYANAVYFARGTIYNNTIRDNYLNVSCTSIKAPWGNYAVVYAIVLEDKNYVGGIYDPERTTVKNNNIINNTVYASARQTYSIELFGAIDLNITENKMYNNGTAPMAIGIIGYNSSIYNNDITCIGTTNRTDGTVDYIVSRTVGVYTYLSDGINITNNSFNMTKGRGIFLTKSNNITIINNMINTTNYDYTIDLNSTNINIQYNQLYSRNHTGDESVNHTFGENITVKHNQYTDTNIEILTNNTTVNKTTTIKVILNDKENDTLSDVNLILTVDDENITITTDCEGSYTYNYTPTNKGIKNITVKLEKYLVFNENMNTTSITIQSMPIIQFEQIEGYVNEDTEITAYITDETGENITSGYVLFKDDKDNLLDNVSLKDGLAKTNTTFSTEGLITLHALYISDNELIADSQNSTNITINTRHPILTVNNVTGQVGSTINLTAQILIGNNTAYNINSGKVIFKVNGKVLKDNNGKVIYVKLVNGTATIENYEIPESWTKQNTTIEAVFSGSILYDRLTSQKTLINITEQIPTLTTNDIITSVNNTITLTATINSTITINKGKIIFKINGKTVKDSNGRVIYAKVINNTVSIEYTIPETFKIKNYTITAVFISPNYEKKEDTKTLTIIS